VTAEVVAEAVPIRGWRAWRVYSIETLRDGAQARLCAVGTMGVPKVWEPMVPVRAVCSNHKGLHEAPDPEHMCECGVYALRSRDRMDEKIAEWLGCNQGGAVLLGWAVGHVNLWGRVNEYELGWRGEKAYPYALTLHSDDEALAFELRKLYRVDVDLAPPLEAPPRETPAIVGDYLDELDELEARIASLKARVAEPEAPPVDEPVEDEPPAQGPLAFTDEELYDALVDATRRHDEASDKWWHEGTVKAEDVANVLFGRCCWFELPELPPFELGGDYDTSHAEWAKAHELYRRSPGPTRGDVARVARRLGRLAAEGRVIRYRLNAANAVLWAPSSMEAGVAPDVKRLAQPLERPVAEDELLAYLADQARPLVMAELVAAFLPAGGDARRMMGHLGMRLARLRKGGLVDKTSDGWTSVAGAEAERRAA
jgi:hypothetical protein